MYTIFQIIGTITTMSHCSRLSHPTPADLENKPAKRPKWQVDENKPKLACSFTRCITIHGRLTTQLPYLLSRTESGEVREFVSVWRLLVDGGMARRRDGGEASAGLQILHANANVNANANLNGCKANVLPGKPRFHSEMMSR